MKILSFSLSPSAVCTVCLSLSFPVFFPAVIPVCRGAENSQGEQRVWFRDLSESPAPLSRDRAGSICEAICKAIEDERAITELLPPPPSGRTPRIVFLSCLQEYRPAIVAVGSGNDLNAALEDAFSRIISPKPPEGELIGLKLDVVQYVRETDDFVCRTTSMPLPSLVGIAFSEASRVALLPGQLVGADLIDTERRLRIHRISEAVLQKDEWRDFGIWNRISSSPQPVEAYFFEAQSFYFDGAETFSVFRGHRYFSSMDREDLLASIERGGDFLINHLGTEGEFTVELPEWLDHLPGALPMADQAAAVLVLVRLYQATGKKSYLEGAGRALEYLLGSMKTSGTDAKAICVIDEFRVSLFTNALAVLAIQAYHDAVGRKPLLKYVIGLGHYLLRQVMPGGDVVTERLFPSGTVTGHSSLRGSAAAVVAMLDLYEQSSQRVFRERAEKVMEKLIEREFSGIGAVRVPRDDWLLRAVSRSFTFSRDEKLAEYAEQVAGAIEADRVVYSEFPDLPGSVKGEFSATLAARHTSAACCAADLLNDIGGRHAVVSRLVQGAQLSLMFLRQHQIDHISGMYLTDLDAHVGAFRDHLLDVGLAMSCQTAQMTALLDAIDCFEQFSPDEIELDRSLQMAIDEIRGKTDRFPRYLLRPVDTVQPLPVETSDKTEGQEALPSTRETELSPVRELR